MPTCQEASIKASEEASRKASEDESRELRRRRRRTDRRYRRHYVRGGIKEKVSIKSARKGERRVRAASPAGVCVNRQIEQQRQQESHHKVYRRVLFNEYRGQYARCRQREGCGVHVRENASSPVSAVTDYRYMGGNRVDDVDAGRAVDRRIVRIYVPY